MATARSKEFLQLRNINCFIESAQALHEFASFGVEPKRLLALTIEGVIFLHIVNWLRRHLSCFFVSPDPEILFDKEEELHIDDAVLISLV